MVNPSKVILLQLVTLMPSAPSSCPKNEKIVLSFPFPIIVILFFPSIKIDFLKRKFIPSEIVPQYGDKFYQIHHLYYLHHLQQTPCQLEHNAMLQEWFRLCTLVSYWQ